MFRTDQSVGMLKTIALIAGLAILLWSLGLPSLKFAEAANVTSYSDVLTDSNPGSASDHTITFTSPTGIPNGGTTTISFPAGFVLTSIDETDVDMASTSDYSVAADCSGTEEVAASVNGQDLELVFCFGDGGSLPAYGTTTIQIGHVATGGTANAQITNPSTEGSYKITVSAGATGALDTGTTHVVIMSNVEVSATVETVFTFSVAGVGPGVTVNGDTTTGSTTSTTIPFGKLSNGVATTTAHRLTVTTNASNGYVVTIQTDGALQSSTGADIDGFANGSDTNTPATWASAPLGADVNDEDTWGHWGFTSDDTDTTRDPGDEFGSQEYAAPSTTPRVVMSHDGPANAALVGIGTTTVGYKVEISALQEAGDDYSAVLTYIATPTF